MSRTRGKWLLVLAALLLPVFSAMAAQAGDSARPDILLVISDDQGWGDFGFNGNPVLETPNIDRLAREGVHFSRFYVSPVCSSTRASLLTGRHFLRTGVWSVTRGGEKMRSEERTLGEVFADAGYRTGLFGKWHNGAQYPYTPRGQGFETFTGFTSGHLTRYFDAELLDDGQPVQTRGFVPDVITDAAIRFVSDRDERPFLAVVAYNTPHSPFELPEADYQHFRDRGLDEIDSAVYGLSRNLDWNLGRLLRALEDKGTMEDTVLLFLSDNGPAFPAGNRRFNGPWRGNKGKVTEGGVRVPLLLSWPSRLEGGRRIDLPAQHIDILPTLAEMAGITMTNAPPLDGISLAPLLAGKQSNELATRPLFIDHFRNTQRPGQPAVLPYPAAVKQGDWSAVREDSGPWRLYRLDEDPGQNRDLAQQQSERLETMTRAHQQHFDSVTAAGFAPLPAELGHEAHPDVEFPAHEAHLHGSGFEYANGDGWAHDWIVSSGEGSGQARWPVRVVRGGRYRLTVQYGAHSSEIDNQVALNFGKHRVLFDFSHFEPETIAGKRVFDTGEAIELHWNEEKSTAVYLDPGDFELTLTLSGSLSLGDLLVKGIRIESITE